MHGGVDKKNLEPENISAVIKGVSNLKRHIENIHKFGLPAIVAVNHFVNDTEKEIEALKEECLKMNVEVILCEHWAKGGEGTIQLAKKIVELTDKENKFDYLYKDDESLIDKIKKITSEIYRAEEVIISKKIKDQLKQYENQGYGNFPICIAKTQYSFSTDPSKIGAPESHSIPIREVRLSSGAEFIVVVCGEIMTMPGLPSVPAANSIKLDSNGQIEGLF
jgi:Formyltetrahydrofolate synthetase